MTKIFQLFSVAFLLIWASTCSATEGMLTYSGAPGYVDGTAGWSFEPTVNISVTSLGAFNEATLDNSPLLVGLWNASGSLLASVSVSSNDPVFDLSHYDSITPVTLLAGQRYYLGAYGNGGTTIVTGEDPLSDVGGFATTSPQIQSLNAVYSLTNGFSFPTTVDNDLGSAIVAANFQFTVVPEPSIIALTLLGGSAVVWRRLRNRKSVPVAQ
jgi:hypothetical protein